MNDDNKIKKEISSILLELTNHLIINGSMVFFSGLFNGKLGISLFFFHYWRYSGNSLYNEYAQYLIELVKSQIHDDYPLDYECGLAGVGAGLDYLKKYVYFDAGDDLMQQIDSRIIKAVSYESRVDMLTGFARYLLARAETCQTIKDYLSIEKEKIEPYLPDSRNVLIQNVFKTISNKKISRFTSISDLQLLLQCEQLFKGTEYDILIPKIKRSIMKNISSFYTAKLDDFFSENKNFAFQGGYAGLGLVLISILAPKFASWTKLL